jgi:hypothetical protein
MAIERVWTSSDGLFTAKKIFGILQFNEEHDFELDAKDALELADFIRQEFATDVPESASVGWIEWKGGDCPVDKGEVVDLEFRGGKLVKNRRNPGGHRWEHYDNCGDIIAYRVVK